MLVFHNNMDIKQLMKRKTTILFSGSDNVKRLLFPFFRSVLKDHTLKMPKDLNLPSTIKNTEKRDYIDGIIIDLDFTNSNLTDDPLLFASQIRVLQPQTTVAVISEKFDRKKNISAEDAEIIWLQAAEVDFAVPKKLSKIEKEKLSLRFKKAMERYREETIGNITFITGNWHNPSVSEDYKSSHRYIKYENQEFLMPRDLFDTLLYMAKSCSHRYVNAEDIIKNSSLNYISGNSLKRKISRINAFFSENGLNAPISNIRGIGYIFTGLEQPKTKLENTLKI